MKKWLIVLIIVIIIFAVLIFVLRGFSGEDNWIKDEKGMWIKHGNPAETPSEVAEQELAVVCAMNLFHQMRASGMNFSSQCLGRCQDYSIDIVHVPRSSEDDIPFNQCIEYISKATNHFIELDKNGEIVKIV